ncbi:MAG: SDR family oxidoreductase [Chloroflexi bacterium]|nr:SDR family oxidoreductase [Chloroflexota bacterium]
MDLGLRGKAAIVTGGSRGIGRSIALGLAAEGCNVAICARSEEKLAATAAEIRVAGVEALGIRADVTRPEDIEKVVKGTVAGFGRVDILVNNAGGGWPGEDDDAWQGTVNINLIAAVRASRLVIPEMRTLGAGRIIHITSIWGREAGGGLPYNAAKAAMISHAKNLALQLAPDKITVNSVAPGSIVFPGGGWQRALEADPEGMAQFIKANIASRRFGKPEEVADVVVFLASERANWVTGACINVDGGQTRSNI